MGDIDLSIENNPEYIAPLPIKNLFLGLTTALYKRCHINIEYRFTDILPPDLRESQISVHGEEFQRVGRTIFIKSKILLFPYTLIISNQI